MKTAVGMQYAEISVRFGVTVVDLVLWNTTPRNVIQIRRHSLEMPHTLQQTTRRRFPEDGNYYFQVKISLCNNFKRSLKS